MLALYTYNIPFSSEKIILSESREIYAQKSTVYKRKHSSTVLTNMFLILLWENNRRWTFSLQEVLLWIIDWCFGPMFKVKCLNDEFSHKHALFTSKDVISCGLLQCFHQLFGLLFWRHPFTAEDPLMSKWWNDTLIQICFYEETNYCTSWIAWG